MISAFTMKANYLRTANFSLSFNNHHCQQQQVVIYKYMCSDTNSSSTSPPSSNQKFRFRLLGRSLGDSKWNFNEIDTSVMQDSVNQMLSKSQNFFNKVTSPLVKTVNDRRSNVPNDSTDLDDIFLPEQTINIKTTNGDLSAAAIFSIEQFSRMNGLTGQKMQKIFKALASESVYNDARNLVEYCCFRFLSRDSSHIHPCLKEPAFRKLIFVTMLAWQQPYSYGKDSHLEAPERDLLQKRLVKEEAFVRIAPTVSGLADWPTIYNLFKALAGEEQGISYGMWSTYIHELLKIYEGRKSYKSQESPYLSGEKILCIGSSRKPPVLKWENNISWPGKLTLTDKALYFEKIEFLGRKDRMRLDLTRDSTRIKRTRVGPLGSDLFDSAVSVTSGSESDQWILEFVDFAGDMRRDVWYSSISEVIAVQKFIHDFGPRDGDESVKCVYGAHKGKERASIYASNAIARLQSLQFMRKLLDEPVKLVPFSYLQNSPYGEIVCQALAVSFWGGSLIAKVDEQEKRNTGKIMRSAIKEASENLDNVVDIDGSVYLRKWMRSPSWTSSGSISFWRNVWVKHGVVLSKNIVVADKTCVQRAAMVFREKCKMAEKTQETIDAALIEGIPSNIDLFKELVLPIAIIGEKIDGLRRWKEPVTTASFLVLFYTIIFRNMMSYIFPMTLMILASSMLLLNALKKQGRLGRYFGRVTVRDQAPSNTIQQIIALKQAMRDIEKYLQELNISLLKIRTIFLAGHPQVTTEVALILMFSATILILVPFKYILSFFVFDLFTRELNFRREMVLRFTSMVKERWDSIPATPVVVLPYEVEKSDASSSAAQKKHTENQKSLKAADNAG